MNLTLNPNKNPSKYVSRNKTLKNFQRKLIVRYSLLELLFMKKCVDFMSSIYLDDSIGDVISLSIQKPINTDES